MFCAHCGKELKNESKFCISCGFKTDNQEATSASHEGLPGYVSGENFDRRIEYETTGNITSRKIQTLDFSQMVSAVFKLYSENYKSYILTTAAVAIPLGLVCCVLEYYTFHLTSVRRLSAVLYDLPALFLCVLFETLQKGAVISAIARSYIGEKYTLGESYKAGVSRYAVLICTSFIVYILTLLLCVLLIVPGVYFMIASMLFPVLIMVEGTKSEQSIQRSIDLVRGSWFKLFGALFVTGLLTGIAVLPIHALLKALASNSLLDPALSSSLMTLIKSLINILLYPVYILVAFLFYVDARVRKEGLDFDTLESEIRANMND